MVFPTQYEPFGLVMIEAMACGTPALGLDVAADGRLVKAALAVGNAVAIPLNDDAGDRADAGGPINGGHLCVSKPARRVHVQPHGDAAPFEAEHGLPILHPRRFDAAGTEDATIAIEVDVGMRGVDGVRRPLVGLGRRDHPKPVAERLKLAIPTRHAIGAGMVALDEEHLDQSATIGRQQRGVVLDHHALRGRRHTGRHTAAVDLAGADTASARSR